MKVIKLILASIFALGFLIIGGWLNHAHADGIDDAKFYGAEQHSQPDEIKVWTQHNDVWLQELPRELLPNGDYMLSPHHINYYHNFDLYPCHYPSIGKPGAQCNEPLPAPVLNGDPLTKHNVPEPELLALFGIGFIGLGLTLKMRNK
jgi:PEP-CTERM motif